MCTGDCARGELREAGPLPHLMDWLGWNDSYDVGCRPAVALLQSESSTLARFQISNPEWGNSCGRTEGSLIIWVIHSQSGCSDVYAAPT